MLDVVCRDFFSGFTYRLVLEEKKSLLLRMVLKLNSTVQAA